MLRTVGGRPGLRRLLVSYFLAASLRCQASSVAGVVQRPGGQVVDRGSGSARRRMLVGMSLKVQRSRLAQAHRSRVRRPTSLTVGHAGMLRARVLPAQARIELALGLALHRP
jgi:hypothetical protein